MKAPDNPFDIAHLSSLLDHFASKAPTLLSQSQQTADLAPRLDRLAELSELPFTLAVVGRMRAGKSSLINAIIGQDLAPVGVNETTATINYFRFAPPDRKPVFRVHWKDKPAQDFPLDQRQQWCGQSASARQTRYIEYFSTAELLKELYIVDTPGTRSVIADHDIAIDNFMAEKRERETLECGGKADAIIYVLGPVARENDKDFLQDFEGQTRQTGSSPFNSIAVLHKWETVDSDDPLETAKDKAERIHTQLRDHVSVVLPLSAPLIQASERLPIDFWNQLAVQLCELSPRMRERVIEKGTESRLQEKIPSLFELYDKASLPWASFRAVYYIARHNNFPEGNILQKLVKQAGGKDFLLDLLNDRFIQRTRLIKSFLHLNRALAICTEARLRLSNLSQKLNDRSSAIHAAYAPLEKLSQKGFSEVDSAIQFLQKSADECISKSQDSEALAQNIDNLTHELRSHFQDLSKDIEYLRDLDDEGHDIPLSAKTELRTLLGCYGQSTSQRLSCYHDINGDLIEHIEDRIENWSLLQGTTHGRMAGVYAQAVNRLESLIDYMEGIEAER